MHVCPGDVLLWVCGGNQEMKRLYRVVPKGLGPGWWLLWKEYLNTVETQLCLSSYKITLNQFGFRADRK